MARNEATAREQARAARRAKFGPAHHLTVDAENQIGLMHLLAGEFAAAEPRLLGSYRAGLTADGFRPTGSTST